MVCETKVVNTCLICGKQFLTDREMFNPVCPECLKARGEVFDMDCKLTPWGDDVTPTQQKIHMIMDSMKDLLLYKNQKYGDSAIKPKKIFYKGDSTNSILIRLDDKLGRVMSNTEEKPRVNDVCDIIGYCTLLLISMGVTKEEIEKFKD